MQLSPAHTRSYSSCLPSHLTSLTSPAHLTQPGGCLKFPSQLSLNVLCCVLARGGSAGQCSIARCGNILTWRQCSSYPQVEEAHITHQQAETPQLPPAPLLRPARRHAFCPPPLVTERSSEKPQSGTIKQNVIHHYPVRSQKANINYLIGVRICAGGHLAGPGDGGLTSGVLGRPAASWCRAEAAASPPTLLLPAATQFCPEMWSCKLLKHNFLSKFCKLASLIMTVNGWSAERAHRTALTGPVLEII